MYDGHMTVMWSLLIIITVFVNFDHSPRNKNLNLLVQINSWIYSIYRYAYMCISK